MESKPKPRARAECWQPADVDTSTLTRDQLFAHYKQTAPLEDTRFFIRHCSVDTICRQAVELEYDILNTTIKRAEAYRRLTALQDQWRRETTRYFVPDEAAFWRQTRIVNRRVRAKAYRERCASVRSDIRRCANNYGYSWNRDTYEPGDSIVQSVQDLVRAARKLAPNAPAFKNEDRYRDPADLSIRKAS